MQAPLLQTVQQPEIIMQSGQFQPRPATPGELMLVQQNQNLIQENQVRAANEINYHNAWKEQIEVNGKLQTTITQMQIHMQRMEKQIQEYEKDKSRPKDQSTPEVVYETDEEELARETEWIRVKNKRHRTQVNTNDPQQNSQNKPKNKEKDAPKAKSPPPIIVDGIGDYNKLYGRLNVLIKEFQIKVIENENIKINLKDGDSYRLVIHMLQEQKYSFHSYENKQTRPIKVMAKNLHYTCKPEMIVEDLRKKGYKLIEATPKLQFQTKKPLNMFMLTFSHDEDINKIYAISSIMGSKVEVVALKKNRLVPQCKKCQGYGHTQKYCAKEPRCVKCTGKHLTIACDKPKNDKPKCIHCAGEHPANYRGCMVAKEMQKIRQNQTKKANRPNPPQRNANPPQQYHRGISTDKRTYSQVVANETGNAKAELQKENTEELLHQILDRLKEMDNRIINLEKRAQGAIPKKDRNG